MDYDLGVSRFSKIFGVASVVEGTVRRDGKRVRIVTRLVDARSDETLWCERYDRDLTDIFGIQSEIAAAVAAKLSAQLSPEEREDIVQRPTEDLKHMISIFRRRIQLRSSLLRLTKAPEIGS